MKHILVFLIFFNALLAGASFDYSKASTQTEKSICDSKVLSGWDEFFARVYRFAREKEQDTEQLKVEQRAWLKERNRCKDDRACIENAYTDRLQYLIDVYVERQTMADDYIYRLVKDYPIKECSTIKRFHDNAVDENRTNEARQMCEFFKENIWDEEAIGKIEIIKPAITAKFFKDKQYQEFLKNAVAKAPRLKTELMYADFQELRGTSHQKWQEGYDEINNYLFHDQIWKARDYYGTESINLNFGGIRLYLVDFDGNSSNGEEIMIFTGMVDNPKLYNFQEHTPLGSHLKIFNLKQKEIHMDFPLAFPTTNALGVNSPLSGFSLLKSTNEYIAVYWYQLSDELVLTLFTQDAKVNLTLHKN
jgi:uncharacterized protein